MDDFFKFLIATDSLDEFLRYEPNCPNCRKKLQKIKKNKSKFKYYCHKCKRYYNEDLKKYIEEKDYDKLPS